MRGRYPTTTFTVTVAGRTSGALLETACDRAREFFGLTPFRATTMTASDAGTIDEQDPSGRMYVGTVTFVEMDGR